MGARYIEGTGTRFARQAIRTAPWRGVMSHAVSVLTLLNLLASLLALAPGGDPDDPAGQHRHGPTGEPNSTGGSPGRRVKRLESSTFGAWGATILASPTAATR